MEKLIEREKEAMNNCKGGQEHKEDIGLEKKMTESNELEERKDSTSLLDLSPQVEHTRVSEMSYSDVVHPLHSTLGFFESPSCPGPISKITQAIHGITQRQNCRASNGTNGSAPIEKQDQIVLNGSTLKGFSSQTYLAK